MIYSDLVNALTAFLDKPEVEASIPIFVLMGEARINRLLRHRMMLETTTLTPSSAFVALPADFLEPLTVTLDTGQQLDNASPQDMAQRVYQEGISGGLPRAYSVVGANLQLYPAPTAALNVELLYYGALAPANPSGNWLLTTYPDIYLSACLYAARVFTREAEEAEAFDALLQRQIQELNVAREGYGARLAPRPSTVI